MFKIIALAMLLSSTAFAHTFDPRSDDDTNLQLVSPVADANIIQEWDFHNAPTGFTTEYNGLRMGARFSGQTFTCPPPHVNNPTGWPTLAPLISSNAKTSGIPSFPLTAEVGGGHFVWNYNWVDLGYVNNASHTRAHSSYSGCGEWADDSWVMAFPEPATSVSITLADMHDHLYQCNTSAERLHFQFFTNDGTAVIKVGHLDLIDEPAGCEVKTLYFQALPGTVIDGVLVYTENGPGVRFLRVGTGFDVVDPPVPPPVPLTLEERVERLESFHE